jgi:phosphatidylinositol alpha-mannosyltransferase
MKIGLLLDDTLDRPDGVQQAVISIGKELTLRGHDVHYIVAETERTDIPNIHSLGKFISVDFNGNSVRTPLPISKQKVNDLYSKINFDVLHVQMPFSPFLSAKIINYAPAKTKIFGTFHILPYNKLATYGTSGLSLLLSNSKKRFNKCFAVSKPALEFMENSFGMTGDILPNPVDYGYYHNFKKQKSKKKQIVFIGRFEKRKGVKELIIAYSKLPKKLQDGTDLNMCGKGPMLEDMKILSKELGVNINFPGFVEDDVKAQFLANADIAVFPSTSGESFGIVLTEAMSAGAGITIGGSNPGYSSVLEPWPITLFDPSNTVEFSGLLSKLLLNDKIRLKTGNVQHQDVKKYDIKYVVDILETCYKSN